MVHAQPPGPPPPPSESSWSSLDTAESAFTVLADGPGTVRVDGTRIGAGFPARPVGLAEARLLLCSPGLPDASRQACWAYLVGEIRSSNRPVWTVGAVGVAMPMLRRLADQLAAGYGGERADLDGEILSGFLAVLRRLAPGSSDIARRLAWGAFHAGLIEQHSSRRPGWAGTVAGAVPPAPWDTPAGVLARAVAQNVLSRVEADVIAATRLRSIPLIAVANRLGEIGEELALGRAAAEGRLARALVTGRLGTSL